MKLVPIESQTNALCQKVVSLHQRSKREKLGLFLLEGAKLLNEAFQKSIVLDAIIASKSFLAEGLPRVDQANFESIFIVDDKLFCKLNTTETSCGILAVARLKEHHLGELFDENRTLLVIGDAIQDPGNSGTMIRTALAFGATGIVFTKGSADPYNPKVVRSAMGALFSLPIVFDIEPIELVSQLRSQKTKLVGLEPSATKLLSQCDRRSPIAYAFGNEGNGLSKVLIEQADCLVQIPTAETTESLNVAVSLGIVLFAHSEIKQARQAL